MLWSAISSTKKRGGGGYEALVPFLKRRMEFVDDGARATWFVYFAVLLWVLTTWVLSLKLLTFFHQFSIPVYTVIEIIDTWFIILRGNATENNLFVFSNASQNIRMVDYTNGHIIWHVFPADLSTVIIEKERKLLIDCLLMTTLHLTNKLNGEVSGGRLAKTNYLRN